MDAPLPGGEEECIPRSGRGEIGSGEGRRAVPFGGGRAIGSTSARKGVLHFLQPPVCQHGELCKAETKIEQQHA